MFELDGIAQLEDVKHSQTSIKRSPLGNDHLIRKIELAGEIDDTM